MKREGINGTSAPITLLIYLDLEEIMKSPATGLPLSPNRGRRKLNELFVNQHLPVIQMKQTAVFPLTNINFAGVLLLAIPTSAGQINPFSYQRLSEDHITRRISNL
jgi:hypothetical protein